MLSILLELATSFCFLVAAAAFSKSMAKNNLEAMYYNQCQRTDAVVQRAPSPVYFQPNLFDNALYGGAGSNLIQSELGAYGEKIVESSSEYMQKNMSKYFPDPHYYFQVNDDYVRNKLKMILFPFLHKGHWTRISEPAGGRLSYKPPIYDINAPDLYIPLMSFGSYLILAGLSLGLLGKFSPEALNAQFTKGLLVWFLQVMVLKVILHLLGSGDSSLLDMVAYGGYAFSGVTLALLAKIVWRYSYYFVITWECFCMGVFLVKIMKGVLFTEMKSCEKNSSHRHYLLLFVAIFQIPLFFWLSNVNA